MYRGEPHYRIAQICINGHVISSTLESIKEAEGKFCSQCRMPTITNCQNCKKPIRGDYYNPEIVVLAEFPAPPFCIYCGNPFPWTESAIRAAKDYAEELSSLKPEERETLKNSIPNIVRDSPQTKVASLRYKKLASKAGGEAWSVLKSILVGVATPAAKNAIWGSEDVASTASSASG